MWYLPSDRGMTAGAGCVKLNTSRRTREHRSWRVAAPDSCAKASCNCKLASCLALVVRDDVMEHEGCNQRNLERLEAKGSVEHSAERTERAAWSDGRLLDGRAVSCKIPNNKPGCVAQDTQTISPRLRSSFKLCSSSTCVTASTDSASNTSVNTVRCSSQLLSCCTGAASFLLRCLMGEPHIVQCTLEVLRRQKIELSFVGLAQSCLSSV